MINAIRNVLGDLRMLWLATPLLGNLVVLPLLMVPFFARRRQYLLPLELKWFIGTGVLFFGYFTLRGLFALPDPGLSGATSRILAILMIAGFVWWCDLTPKKGDLSAVFAWVPIVAFCWGAGEYLSSTMVAYRVELLTGNPLFLAPAILPFVFINAWYAAPGRHGGALHYIAFTLSLILIGALCGARSGYLAALCAIAIHVGVCLAQQGQPLRAKLMHLFTLAAGVFVSGLSILAMDPGGRFSTFVRWASSVGSDTPSSLGASGSLRFDMWRASAEAISHAPIFGYGPQNRFEAIRPYLSSEFTDIDLSHPHNLIFTLGNGGGLVGIFLGVLFITSVCIGHLMSREKSGVPFEILVNSSLVTLCFGVTNYVLFEGYMAIVTSMTLIGPVFLFSRQWHRVTS